MVIKETNSEGMKIVLTPVGSIDTISSPELQSAILKGFQKTDNLVLDFSEVTYISSAGLRALLIGQKTASSKGGSLVIRNVAEAVMKVFKMVNFDKALQIEE